MVGISALADIGVEEGTEAGTAESETGVEGRLNDDIERTLGGEQESGLDQEMEMLLVLGGW